MSSFTQAILRFLREEDGLETVEYAVAGSMIVAASVLAFTNLGTAVAAEINRLTTCISTGC